MVAIVNDGACRFLLSLALVAVVTGLPACSGQQKGRKSNATREQLKPVQVQLTVGLPFDSDGNGYPDTMQAVVYLFPDSRFSDQPVRDEGTFDFVMNDPTGALAARWVFPPEIVAQAERRMPAGPAYSMYLRLAEGKDVMRPTPMDVRVQFVSVTGTQVRSSGRSSVRLGG